jgi:anti-anti-sigma regulatory factor
MLSPSPLVLLPGTAAKAPFVIDLIGDLDAPLTESLTEALEGLVPPTGERIVIRLKHITAVRPHGVVALAGTLVAQRRAGRDVRVVSESGRVRALLRAARIEAKAIFPADRCARVRHLMIAHNANPMRDCA